MEAAAVPSADASAVQTPPKSYSELFDTQVVLDEAIMIPNPMASIRATGMKSISDANTRVNHGVYADCGNWPIALTGGGGAYPPAPGGGGG